MKTEVSRSRWRSSNATLKEEKKNRGRNQERVREKRNHVRENSHGELLCVSKNVLTLLAGTRARVSSPSLDEFP